MLNIVKAVLTWGNNQNKKSRRGCGPRGIVTLPTPTVSATVYLARIYIYIYIWRVHGGFTFHIESKEVKIYIAAHLLKAHYNTSIYTHCVNRLLCMPALVYTQGRVGYKRRNQGTSRIDCRIRSTAVERGHRWSERCTNN